MVSPVDISTHRASREQGRGDHGPHGVCFISSRHISLTRHKCADDSKNFSVGGTNRYKSSSIDVHTRPCVEETASGKLLSGSGSSARGSVTARGEGGGRLRRGYMST